MEAPEVIRRWPAEVQELGFRERGAHRCYWVLMQDGSKAHLEEVMLGALTRTELHANGIRIPHGDILTEVQWTELAHVWFEGLTGMRAIDVQAWATLGGHQRPP